MGKGDWEAVIGLEVHLELNTCSKLFCSAANQFGGEPNTRIGQVSTGQPGALPVLNREAVYKAVRLGCALKSEIAQVSRFDRKSYFYPDSPRNFQITQFNQPIIIGGAVLVEVEGKEHLFAVRSAHLEDDAGMLKHTSSFTAVDYNRAGVPLIEVVFEPCMQNGAEAAACVRAMRTLVRYIEISNGNMQEGSLRVDANVSVRKVGEQELRNKVEIKNLNSLAFLQMAIDGEICRQIRLYESELEGNVHQVVLQGTYRWDEEKGCTILMRRKEDAEDYRYFPEPDLTPIVLDREWIDCIREELPELPSDKKARYLQEYGLSIQDVEQLVEERALALYFEEAVASCSHPKMLCNWMLVEFGGRCRERGISLMESGIQSQEIATLVSLINQGEITGKIAKKVADEMMDHPERSCRKIIEGNSDYRPLIDEGLIANLCREVVQREEKSVSDYLAGKQRAFAFLVGQVMKKTKGKAPPQIVNRELKRAIQERGD